VVRTPHANGEPLESPSLTLAKVPAGGRYEGEPAFCPQHTTLASVLTPHVWVPPALTEANVPLGAVASPSLLRPQQATVLSVLRAHVCRLPALTDLNVPDGAVACPWSFKPQQTMVVSSLTAHE
jgi:hypothetical protein